MSTANIDDRASIEALYPLEAFERDAALNARNAVTDLQGVRITSNVDEAGNFEMARTARHVGETSADEDSRFVAAYRSNEASAVKVEPRAGYGGEQALEAPVPGSARRDYDAFVDRIVAAARRADFPPPVGKGDDRLRGFRGG